MRLNNVIVITLTLLSAPVMGAGDMFLDLPKDSNVSGLGDRHYSAVLGRFITPDTAKISISEYTYNNVILSSDPSGLGIWRRIVRAFRSAPIETMIPRAVAHNDDAAQIHQVYSTHSPNMRGTRGTRGPSLPIVSIDSIGAAGTSMGRLDVNELRSESEDENVFIRRLRTHNDDSSYTQDPERRPAWSKPSRYSKDIDLDVTRVKGKSANISDISDDDLGPPVFNTVSGSVADSTNFVFESIPPRTTDIEMTPMNTPANEYHDQTGLTKTKKIMIGAGVIALSAGTAALTAYFLLKNKNRLISTGPSPAPPGPVPTPCPGMTPHPPPC